MMSEKRVLILSEAFGAGHTKAAEAIKSGIELLNPGWRIEVIELGSWLRPKLNYLITDIYLKTLRFSPKLWGVIYRRIQDKSSNPKVEFILHRIIYAHIMKLLQEYQPDVIISTHPFPSAVISRLKRLGLKVPLHTVLTDFGAHGSWISSGVDYYYVPSIQTKKELIKLGVAGNRVIVTGIPTNPKFWKRESKELIRKKLGLEDKPTVLYMGGGLGLGLTNDFIEGLSHLGDIQLLIVTGKNKKLFSSLHEHFQDKNLNIQLYGFVENVDELMDAADLLITKPGGVTSAEAIEKGLPMLLLNPIPGQEEDNSSYIVQNKLGLKIHNEKEMNQILEEFLKEPTMLSGFRYPAFNGKKTIEKIALRIG